MSVLSWALAKVAGLRPAEIRTVTVERDLRIALPDGVELIADRLAPDPLPPDAPILLTRTPYGRSVDRVLGRLLAERGYQVVIVSCRGTFGSGGDWHPMVHEADDGRAVLDWLARQPWFTPNVGTFGASYVGFTQWSVAGRAPEFVRAIAPTVTTARFRDIFYPGGTFALETALTWIYALAHQELPMLARMRAMRAGKRLLASRADVLPLVDNDRRFAGEPVPAYQEWLEHDESGDPYWEPLDFRPDLSQVPPASLVAGWYDLFIAPQLRDFEQLQAEGRPARLVVGPWHHASRGLGVAALRATLDWMDRYLRGIGGSEPGDPVRLHVLGADRWVGFGAWPPPAEPVTWHFHPGGALRAAPAPASAPDRYRYDPADPTPAVGGATLLPTNAGPKDQRSTEARADVLTFTSDPLPDDVTVIGPVAATVHIAATNDHLDVVLRLCEVNPEGVSTNRCDGIVRLTPAELGEGPIAAQVELQPTACTFRRGHRIRVQVASAAHPLYARNPGSGEPLGKATTLVPADVEVFHDPHHPSAIELPTLAQPVRGRGRRGLRVRR
jgi:putative CocE/NonD family hydrolase